MIRFIAVGRKGLNCVALAVAVMMMGGPVAAGAAVNVPGHDGGHHPVKRMSKWPQATLQAQARVEVAHDTVRIVLAAEVSDSSQDLVSQALTRAVKNAMDRALDNTDDIKVRSGNYRVWPMNDKDGNISNWRGRGEISLESTDFAAASKLAAGLSDFMAVASVNFSVSPQTRAEEEQKLLNQAAQAFRTRAQELARAMGYSGYRLRNIDLGGSGAHYEVASRGMSQPAAMFSAADSSIPLEGGTETVSVSIHGSVFLTGEITSPAQ